MNVLFMLALVLTVVLIVKGYRKQRDRETLTGAVRERGGEVVELKRFRRGHPFSDAGRGWWAWQVRWRSGGVERVAWALTTKEGIKEWRD